MLILLATLLFGLPQVAQTGAVVGAIPARHEADVRPERVTVAILTAQYSELWKRMTQTRLDAYWEAYKPQFVMKKELFLQFNRNAERDSLKQVLQTMHGELGGTAGNFIRETTEGGKFEFKNLPFGTYRIVAIGTSDFSDSVWTTSVEVREAVPVFVFFGKPTS
jgi:hypothetical protein